MVAEMLGEDGSTNFCADEVGVSAKPFFDSDEEEGDEESDEEDGNEDEVGGDK